MADTIKIKRSDVTATPSSLATGELAYSENSGNLFIGRIADGVPVKIGGKLDVDKLAAIEAAADVTDTTNVDSAGAVMETDYNANTILSANADNTPLPLTIGSSTIFGRAAAGDAVALTGSQVRTLINVEDGATAEVQATQAVEGISQIATAAEVNTGTADSGFAISPLALAGSALQTKVDGIEALADVTDNINVDAAGATMNTDTDVSANGWVVDEDAMGSNLDTKVPTQQSVVAYVATEIAAAVTSEMSYKGAYNAATNSPDLDTIPITIAKGDTYTCTVAGTFFTTALEIGDVIIAEIASAAVEADWTIINKNIDSSAFATAAQGTLADSALQDITAEPFTDLNDTPANYTAAAGFFVKVNSTPNGLEFVDGIDGGTF